MGLETGDYITDLVITNPVGSTDTKSTLDDHARLIKKVVKQSFPNIDGAVTFTPAQANALTSVTPGTSAASKALILDASSKIDAVDITALTINGVAVTSTAAELNILDGVTANATELNYLDGATAGTVLTTGDEGSGNGIDADTLDGAHGSAYAKKADAETVTGAWTFTVGGGGTINMGANTNLVLSSTSQLAKGAAVYVNQNDLYPGRVNSGGTTVSGPSGWTVNSPSTGIYDVTHSLGTTNISAIATAENGTQMVVDIVGLFPNSIQFKVTDTAGTLTASAFHFFAHTDAYSG